MATKRSNSGIVITRGDDVTHYRGTKEALISGGVCSEDEFPVAPQCKSWCCNGKEYWELTRRQGGVFEVRRWPSIRTEPMRPRLRKSAQNFKESIASRVLAAR